MHRLEIRIGTLCGRDVVDADGARVGRVHSVRLRRDGPVLAGFGPALRLEGLLVGKGSIASRLGLNRRDITGPWPLDRWGKRAAYATRLVPVDCVEDLTAPVITCTRRRDELPRAYDL